jgi:hypothetical protein|tara:strand:+ start:2325 stop:3287 length:963 start_codon:yes stop_codon:yes gene_type:complete
MKLIMENWREYLTENQQASYHDNLYLFENDTIKNTSFNDTLDALTESDDDIEAFLENWEKSIDYELQQLNEGIVGDFIFNASIKVFQLMDKIKNKIAKHAVKIIKFVNKIRAAAKRFEKKYPKTYKFAALVAKVIILIVAYYVISSLMGSADAQAGDVIQPGRGQDPEAIIRASEGQLRYIGESFQEAGYTDLAEKFFDIANNPEDVTTMDLGYHFRSDLSQYIEQGVQSMEELGIEVDAAGDIIDKAQEIVNSLPELTQQPDLATADLVTGKALIPDGGVTQDLVAAADKLALDKIDGAGEVFKRVERDGYIYSIARPQ